MTAPRAPTRYERFLAWLRRAAVLAVALVALGVVGWQILQVRVDEEIRAVIEKRFQDHYDARGLRVRVASARRVPGKGLRVWGLAIHEPQPADSVIRLPPLVEINEILLACDPAWNQLWEGKLPLDRISIRRLRLRAERLTDGSWNVASLWPTPPCGDRPAPIDIEQASVEIRDARAPKQDPLVLRDLELRLAPDTVAAASPGSAPASPSGIARPSGNAPRSRFSGRLSCEHWRALEFAGWFHGPSQSWAAAGTLRGARIAPDIRKQLPVEWAGQLALLDSLRGVADLEFQCASAPAPRPPIEFNVTGRWTEGRVEDPRLPYPLTDLRADFHVTQDVLTVRDLAAKSGFGDLRLSGSSQGWRMGSPLTLRAEATDVLLNERLERALPEALRKVWKEFAPTGKVNARLALTHDGQAWLPDLLLRCVDVGFTHEKFPYHVRGVQGDLRLMGQTLQVKLRGQAAGRPVRIDGEFANPGPNYTGGLSIAVEGPIPLDEELLAALDDKAQRIVRSLGPQGQITFAGRFERAAPPPAPLSQRLEIGLQDCGIKYDRFPYPIQRIRGKVTVANGEWKFTELEGGNDSGYVVGEGSWSRAEEAEGVFSLRLNAADVPLEDELRDALPAGARRAWNELRPRGNLDHLQVGIRYSNRHKKLTVDVQARKWPHTQDASRALSAEPTFFPYALEDVTGHVTYRDGVIEWPLLQARHGKTRITCQGRCDFADERWAVEFQRFTAERARADHDLVSALPGGLGPALEKLRVEGPFTVAGALRFQKDGPNVPLQAGWDVRFDLENGKLNWAAPVEHIHGGVRLRGQGGEQGFFSVGELELDSVLFQGVQFTRVGGPLALNRERVVFGARAEPAAPDRPPRSLSAKLLGGDVLADAEMEFGGEAPFRLRASWEEGDLRRFSRELAPSLSQLQGKVYALLKLQGSTAGLHTLRGDGMVRLRQADIYELPVMLAMLKTLAVRRPDTTAFTSSDIDFRVHGDHVTLDRVDFHGDAVTLKGNGWVNLQRDVDINFYTQVGRQQPRLPLLAPALGAASRQLLLIHVGGSLDQPRLEKQAFPGLNDTLKQLFPEVVEGVAEPRTARR